MLRHARRMIFDVALSASAAQALEAVDDAARIARDARSSLRDLAARVTPVVADADWRAPSAQAFHDRLEQWRTLLLTAERRSDDVTDALARARADIQARAWAELP